MAIATCPVMNGLLLLNSSPKVVRYLSSRLNPPSFPTSAFCQRYVAASGGSLATFDFPSEVKYVGEHWAAKWVIVDS